MHHSEKLLYFVVHDTVKQSTMKRLFSFLLVCIALHFVVNAQSNDEKQVAAAVDILKKAMIDADQSKLDALTASNLSYGHSSGKIEDKAAFMNALVSGTSDFVSIDLSEQSVKITGNTAIVRHTLSGSTIDGGKPANVKLAVLTVWQKQQGKWKLLARQAVKLA